MEITNFGAVMKFALERESEILHLLLHAEGDAGLGELRRKVSELARLAEKNIKLLERTRRENINEMVLEPISGLNEADYAFQIPSGEGMTKEKLIGFLDEAGARMARFYGDASRKLPVDEAKRVFERLAKKRNLK